MAYNPFNVFRRNQKGLFAILTVFVMIMFVLSFGQGDFFSWLPGLVGANRGDTMAKIDGDKVTDADLGQINMNRSLASDFMIGSLDIASNKMDNYLKESIGQASRENKQFFLSFLRVRNSPEPYVDFQRMVQEMFGGQMNVNDELLRMILPSLANQPDFPQRVERNRNQTLAAVRGTLSTLIGTAGTSKEDLDIAKTAMNLMELDLKRIFDIRNGYFTHKTSDEAANQAAFEFELWLRKAKQLGINFSAEDARRLYLDEFFNQIDNDAIVNMEKNVFSNRTNYSREVVFKALADEFKVRVAQNAVLGRGQAIQVFPTSWDTFEYYRKECDGATYALFSVPAENYISRVTDTPHSSEMNEIYRKYRSVEADPAGDNLGLREPRRLKIGWIEVKGDEAYYKKAGEASLALGEAHAKAVFAAMLPVSGTGFGLLTAPAVWNLTDGALTGAYSAYKQEQQQKIDLTWFSPTSRVELQDVHVAQPEIVAAMVAASGGAFATGGGPAFAAEMMVERARQKDREGRMRALAILMTMPSPAGTGLLGSHLAMWATLPRPIPLGAIRHELVEKVKAEATKKAAVRDVEMFQTEVAKLGEKTDKAEANAYIAKYVAERGLKFGESKDFHDQYTLGDDAGLEPLVAKSKRGHMGLDVPLQFGRAFFFEQDPTGMSRREVETKKLFDPKPFPESGGALTIREGEANYLAWRAAEQAAASPTSQEKATPRIIDLWKRMKARKLAEKAAEGEAKKLRETLSVRSASDLLTATIFGAFSQMHVDYQAQFTDFNDKTRSSFFTIDNVSPISMTAPAIPTFQPPQPQPFQLRPKTQMPYPTFEMQETLLENKDKPFGTTLVLHEKSKDRFYVTVLMDRQFRHYNAMDLHAKFMTDAYTGLGDLTQVLRGQLRREETLAAVKNAILLLKAEFKVTDESDKLKPGEKKK